MGFEKAVNSLVNMLGLYSGNLALAEISPFVEICKVDWQQVILIHVMM